MIVEIIYKHVKLTLCHRPSDPQHNFWKPAGPPLQEESHGWYHGVPEALPIPLARQLPQDTEDRGYKYLQWMSLLWFLRVEESTDCICLKLYTTSVKPDLFSPWTWVHIWSSNSRFPCLNFVFQAPCRVVKIVFSSKKNHLRKSVVSKTGC